MHESGKKFLQFTSALAVAMACVLSVSGNRARRVSRQRVGSPHALANLSVLLFGLLLYASTAMMGEAQAATSTYYWQDDSGTSIAGFTTDSPACGAKPRDIFITTTMSAGGFNCTSLWLEGRAAPPQDLMLMINDTAYATATFVRGVDFALDFLDVAPSEQGAGMAKTPLIYRREAY
ncbi:MAG: hypothetical protein O6765_02605 [Gammaproteobacteria bacterium]|nr:hypothetical protein [Gammaproteobacteria bacterium]